MVTVPMVPFPEDGPRRSVDYLSAFQKGSRVINVASPEGREMLLKYAAFLDGALPPSRLPMITPLQKAWLAGRISTDAYHALELRRLLGL